jgi:hypothetical protein
MDEVVHPTEEQLTDYDENGVDLTLIRWWQSLTPLEQLRFVDQQNTSIARILERNDRK